MLSLRRGRDRDSIRQLVNDENNPKWIFHSYERKTILKKIKLMKSIPVNFNYYFLFNYNTHFFLWYTVNRPKRLYRSIHSMK